jgi:hypothetical protein
MVVGEYLEALEFFDIVINCILFIDRFSSFLYSEIRSLLYLVNNIYDWGYCIFFYILDTQWAGDYNLFLRGVRTAVRGSAYSNDISNQAVHLVSHSLLIIYLYSDILYVIYFLGSYLERGLQYI